MKVALQSCSYSLALLRTHHQNNVSIKRLIVSISNNVEWIYILHDNFISINSYRKLYSFFIQPGSKTKESFDAKQKVGFRNYLLNVLLEGMFFYYYPLEKDFQS